MDKVKAGVGGIIIVLGILLLVSLIIGLPVMLLWNWLMPVIFGLVKISFWQAVGLSLLSGILFKNTSSKSND